MSLAVIQALGFIVRSGVHAAILPDISHFCQNQARNVIIQVFSVISLPPFRVEITERVLRYYRNVYETTGLPGQKVVRPLSALSFRPGNGRGAINSLYFPASIKIIL